MDSGLTYNHFQIEKSGISVENYRITLEAELQPSVPAVLFREGGHDGWLLFNKHVCAMMTEVQKRKQKGRGAEDYGCVSVK